MRTETQIAFDGPAPVINRISITVKGDLVRIAFLEQGSGDNAETHFRSAVALSTVDGLELGTLLVKLLTKTAD